MKWSWITVVVFFIGKNTASFSSETVALFEFLQSASFPPPFKQLMLRHDWTDEHKLSAAWLPVISSDYTCHFSDPFNEARSLYTFKEVKLCIDGSYYYTCPPLRPSSLVRSCPGGSVGGGLGCSRSAPPGLWRWSGPGYRRSPHCSAARTPGPGKQE